MHHMKKRLSLVTVAAATAAVLAFAACSNDDNNGTGPGTDTTPPTVSSVTSVDARHVNVRFSEPVDRTEAETESNYTIEETAPSTTVSIMNASLGSDGRTAMLTTTDSLTTAGYTITISGIEDRNGNEIKSATTKEFAGSSLADATPPQIVHRTPDSDATGVSPSDSITVEFSEPLAASNFETAFAMTSEGNAVPVTITTSDNVHFTIHPNATLNTGKLYTISLTGVQDVEGNVMTNTTWSFHTSGSTSGNVAPQLVGSTPANNAVNVGTSSNIVLTFSEPVDTMSFVATFTPALGVAVTPAWSADRKTATFTPAGGLTANQQYSMIILPNGVRSLGGVGNQDPITLTFTTGATLEVGSISGKVTGPASGPAHNPSGATVLLASADPFGGGDFGVVGAGTVKSNGTYTVTHLPPGTYFPFVIMDSNQDKVFDPLSGDAVGMFGANFGSGDTSPDSVVVTQGVNTPQVDIPIYDPTAISGQIQYSGSNSAGSNPVFVGLFSPTNFNPSTSVPVVATSSTWSGTGTFLINSLTLGPIPNGNYYVGGFMDVNGNGLFDPQVDPFGVAGGNAHPTTIAVNSGKDFPNTTLTLQDPVSINELPTGVLRWNAHWRTSAGAWRILARKVWAASAS
jgi:methionine-rich copper-binding protein CopC